MRMSQIFGRTLRQAPSADDTLTGLALRAAMVRLIGEDLVLLPLGKRVIENLIQDIGTVVDDTQMIVVPPGDPVRSWMDLIHGEVQSYRQLPVNLHSRRVIRLSDAIHGLSRPSWITALQWLHAVENKEQINAYQMEWLEKIDAWFQSVGLTPRKLEWRSDTMGWTHLYESGPESLLECASCDYLADQQVARFVRSCMTVESLEEPTRVATPGADTIEELAKYLDVPLSKTLKAVFLMTEDGRLVFAVLRGDLEISPYKLAHAIQCLSLEPANEFEIRKAGAEPGYASPVGLHVLTGSDSTGVLVVGDVSIEKGKNLIAGANEPGFHLTGVNYPRDFEVTLLEDIAQAQVGDVCVMCEGHLISQQGIYLGGWQSRGNIFHFTDVHGMEHEGSAGLGSLYLEPILAALIDVCQDDAGLSWPMKLSPFDVYLVEIRAPEAAIQAFEALESANLAVLYDDRELSAGVKFADADLIGATLRVTVSKRSLDQGGVELSYRAGGERSIVPLARLGEAAEALLCSIM